MNKITGYHESSAMPQRLRDILGRLKVSVHQNVYEADFEYGTQPLRWEPLTVGSGSVAQVPSSGGVRMRVGNTQGDVALRQSRPYHRYQPGKTMFMATGCQLGPATTGQIQRVGFFDDQNGVFFEQGIASPTNPFGMYVVVRTDVNGQVNETRVGLDSWNGDQGMIKQLDFNRIQMFWIEYGWYGAGATRFGFWIDGEPVIAHQIGWGNYNNTVNGSGPQTTPWARTGNLPVRYEIRNLTAVTPTTSDMYHYGVSVIVEGQRDEQRGFTYSYGLPNWLQTRSVGSATTRYPLLTIRGRQLGTQEYGSVYVSSAGATPTAQTPTAVTASAFTGTIVGTTLTTSSVTGTLAVGQQITGVGVTQGTYITAGSGSTWTVNVSQTVATTSSMKAYVLPLTFPAGTFTGLNFQGRSIFFPGQGGTAADKNGIICRIIGHDTTTLWLADPVTGGAPTTVPVIATQVTQTATAGTGTLPTGTGITGSYVIAFTNTTGITAGMSIVGVGVPTGTVVTSVTANTNITVNQALTANATASTYTFNTGYCIGLINRGQLLPKRLMLSSDTRCVVEVIAGSIANSSILTGPANFVPQANSGSANSFAERDFSATGITGGEVVFAFTLAAGSGLQDIDFSYFFALYNSIRGAQIDQLSVCVTTVSGTTSVVGAHLICQEAMS